MEEELRKQAVQRYLAGETPKAVYSSLDRSKKWFFKWLGRYQSGADDWYQEHSRAPLTRPSELSAADKELITATRIVWTQSHLRRLVYLPSNGSCTNWGCRFVPIAPSTEP
jgi:transposase-like protein